MAKPGDEGTCFELFDSVGSDFDLSSGTARRSFIVGQTEITPVMPLGFPNLGEVHPRYPGLYCDRIGTAGRTTQYACEMYALYSSNGQFRSVLRRPGIDLQRGYLSIDPERAEVSIPFLVATARTVPIYENGEDGRKVLTDTGTSWEWVNIPRKVALDRQLWSRSVDVASFNSADQDAINAQIGQIHTFPNGRKYQMLAPTIRQKTAQVYTLGYQWRTEPTLPAPGYPPFPGDPGFPMPTPAITEPVLSNFYVTANDPRPPFFVYQVVPGVVEYSAIDTGARISIPGVFVVDAFPEKRNNTLNPNGLGWANLPGGPLNDL